MILETPDGPTASDTGADALAILLDQLRMALVSVEVPVERMLNPGITASKVRRMLAERGLGAPEEIVVWFGWANGWHAPSAGSVSEAPIPYLENASLEDALYLYGTLLQVPEFTSSVSGLTDINGWLPLSQDNWGRFVYCNGPAGEPPLVRRTNPEPWNPATRDMFRGRSLCTLVSWCIEAIETRATTWNATDNNWEINQARLPAMQVRSAL